MTELMEILNNIDPVPLSYEEWLNVGMCLKNEGLTSSDWDTWSQRDQNRYNSGECLRKWESFRGNGKPITAGTLVKLAQDQGWTPTHNGGQVGPGRALDWDEEIGGDEHDYQIVDNHWLQDEDVPEPSDWNPVQDLIKYLSTLFRSEEHVAYVTESWYNEKAEKYLPKKGNWDRTAGALIDALQSSGDVGAVFGDYKDDVGAWIRFNPFDGIGIRDENVTAFRYALVESDELSIEKQYAIIKQLELPVAAMVHSGGKSLHAILHIEASDYKEYRERVDFLYEVCQRNGLKLDRQNRNPSRLSRMPGVTRKGRKQFLVATNIGQASWLEWREHIEDLNDDLPDITELPHDETEPELSPEMIEGVLRQGHKMLLAGPSKAGKSFALAQLCLAAASGGKWFGWQVAKGKVLYVNLELDAKSSRHRFWKICQQQKCVIESSTLDVWNLRGHATTLDKLAPKLIRRALKKRYKLVVIDPIYKVITGDENSASEMANFCNHFDQICNELGAAVVCCHHHSKGAQGQKNSRDRSSGSGVFSRDPDAIIDLIELEINEDRRKQIVNRFECDAMAEAFDKRQPCWREKCPQDDAIVSDKLAEWANENGYGHIVREVRPGVRESAKLASAWRIEGTVREFPSFAPKQFFYRYPLHVADLHGLLTDAKADGEEPPWMANKKDKKQAAVDRKKEQKEALENAFEACGIDDEITVEMLAEYMAVTPRTIRNRITSHPDFRLVNGNVEREKQ